MPSRSRSRRNDCCRSAHELLREIVGEIVPDLAAPTRRPAAADAGPGERRQWVQSGARLEPGARSRAAWPRTSRHDEIDDPARQSAADAEPVGHLQRRRAEPRADAVPSDSWPRRHQPIDAAAGRPTGTLDLRFPIYTGGLNRSRIQQSVYQHRAASEALERIARQTERQTRDAYLGVISEISRVRALRQAVESNRTALRATEAGFEVGTQTTVDVLASQDNLRHAETTYSRSRYDYMITCCA